MEEISLFSVLVKRPTQCALMRATMKGTNKLMGGAYCLLLTLLVGGTTTHQPSTLPVSWPGLNDSGKGKEWDDSGQDVYRIVDFDLL
ncbi:hypothetical protein NDU88_000687 [Pleurodeles waltl]|uniref:Uncharacterized protein n=1 Tax=Pleurodeles waltl TaxID=8319 RepID=A0AAV7S7P2_PLEWA|nr:hypothetical protein NDU88_000687 [Pleurodeles waltl]